MIDTTMKSCRGKKGLLMTLVKVGSKYPVSTCVKNIQPRSSPLLFFFCLPITSVLSVIFYGYECREDILFPELRRVGGYWGKEDESS